MSDSLRSSCPCIQAPPHAALYNAAGTGYIQQSFTFTCECGFEITKNTLGAFKFVHDLVKDDLGSSLDSHLAYALFHTHQGHSRYHLYIRGTLHTPTNKVHIERARLVKKNIMQSRVFRSDRRGDNSGTKLQGLEWENQILGLVEYSLDRIQAHAGTKMKGGGGKL